MPTLVEVSGAAKIALSAGSERFSFTRCGPFTRGILPTEMASDVMATSASAAYHR